MDRFVIIGGSGHCASVISSVPDKNLIFGIIDKNAGSVMGINIIGDDSEIENVIKSGIKSFHIAVGDNKNRQRLHNELVGRGMTAVTIIDKSAVVCVSAVLGAGTFVGKNAVVNARAIVGASCIVNSGAIIEHDCVVESFCHCAPGSVMLGDAKIEEAVFLGANSTLLPKIVVAQNVVIGAGSVVTKNIRDAGAVYFGVPAKPYKEV